MQNCTRLFMIVAIMMLGINGFAQDRVLNFLSSFDAGSFDEGAAEIVAYDAISQTLFYVNAEVDAIGTLDISDPANPVAGTDIDITPYGEAVNSVAVSNGILAAAIAGMDQMPGKIVLFDNTGAFVAEYAAGVLPDMVTFSPNGQLVLSANEGEPDDDYVVDPEGSVTVVDISAGAAAGVVTQIPFDVLNDQKTSLINSGVRIFGPGATVAQDLEPEYIAVTDDNTVAYVSCQENNAMVVIDLTTSTIEGVLPLGFKDHNSGAPMLEEYRIDQIPSLPTLGTPVYDGGQAEVMLGGFSGLWYEASESSASEYVFYGIPDRGPNDGAVNKSLTTPPAAGNLRPFKLPNYQGRIVRFTLDVPAGTLALDSAEQIYLTHPNGRTPISGRGNAPGIDEVPVTYTDAATVYGDSSFEANGEYYHLLEYDQYGGDFEGIVIDPAGNFWMCDEYRPAIYQFSPEGVMLNRFIPEGTKARVVTDGIFFSEYGEGSSNNKFLEIYNGTSDTVNLEDYMLVNCGNACTTPGEFEFDNSGLFTGKSIAPQEVFVIAHPSAQADILAEADTQFQFLSNGNDWFAILNKSDSSLVDQIGESATSGITDGWDVAGVPTATKDYTLIRKHYILSGSTDWTASAGTDSVNSEWIVEERPTADTVLSSLGSHMDYGTESLPAVYGKRRANRGFEALALDTDEGILYAFIQTPLYNPSSVTQNNSDVIRVLGIDPATGTPVREYVYLLERNATLRWDIGRVDKIGDAVYVGGGKFRILERDSSVPGENEGKKYVFEFNIKGATNILGTPLSLRDTGTATLELLPLDQLADSGVVPVHKRKILNLPTIGYQASDKPEGLAMLPNGQMAVLNDNDFGLAGAGVSDASTLGIISFDTNYGIDPSDRDDSIRIVNVPVLGPYQPDAMDLFNFDGKPYLITANEGDGRDYDGYSEEDRVKDLLLDSLVFPNFSVLQEDEEIGRLTITTANGDLDGDGDFDEIYAYGSRSFSIWDAYGNLVWDSGDDLERITGDLYPDFFNSNNDDNDSFESRSDNKGPEPEAVVVADLDTALYAFVGLERMGGIMVYRIDDPAAPEFIEYELNRNFGVDADSSAAGDLGPEDLKFISASESPNGIPLIVVGNEVSGTISIYQLFEEPIIISNDAPINLKPLVAFPNPANGNEIYLNQQGNYQLLNLVGQELSRVSNSDRFDISALNAGMYLIRNDQNQTVRFIKR